MRPRFEAAILGEIEARKTRDKPDLPVFGTIDVRKAWRLALATTKVNDKPIDPHAIVPHHTCRHSGATWAANSTKDGLAVQALGRWRSPAMVARYTHADSERARALLDAFK